MITLALWQRLSLWFAVLLIACFGAAGALQMGQSLRHGQLVEQRLLGNLAKHIAAEARVMGMAGDDLGPDPVKLAMLSERLHLTNPGIELYVLDDQGRIESRYPQDGALRRETVDLAPVHDFIDGMPPPVLGDDPLSAAGRKVFSVAPWPRVGTPPGYLYAVLQGSAYDNAADAAGRDAAIKVALWSVGLVTPLGLVAGFIVFRLVTRPLSELTSEVGRLERQGRHAAPGSDASTADPPSQGRDEIAVLRAAFLRLAASNQAQWDRLRQQDQQRREWVANISHDLRTPLASLQGYLETLLLKSTQLSEADREQYLRTALSQSQGLSRLAHEMLELARLELDVVKPVIERFSIVDLAHDVIQKLALATAARRQKVELCVAQAVPDVVADIGMIERVLTNLLDNAIRHSPDGGHIRIALASVGDGRVEVEVADSGPGIAPASREGLFVGPSERRSGHGHSGLGLAIVRQILRLHGDDVRIEERPGCGAVFIFGLRAAGP